MVSSSPYFDVVSPEWALLLPLAIVPFIAKGIPYVAVPAISMFPRDKLGEYFFGLLKLIASLSIILAIFGLAVIRTPEVVNSIIGSGAEIVILLDRSQSMDQQMDSADGRSWQTKFGGASSKIALASQFLKKFVGGRNSDMFSLLVFSDSTIPAATFTRKNAFMQAAIAGTGMGASLGGTDLARGIISAVSQFDGRPYSGARLLVLVTDGGAVLDAEMQKKISSLIISQKIRLIWIYLKSPGSDSKFSVNTSVGRGDTNTPEEQLHEYFSHIGVPYKFYKASDPDSLRKAIEDVDRSEKFPIQYMATSPGTDLSPFIYGLAAIGCFFLFFGTFIVREKWA